MRTFVQVDGQGKVIAELQTRGVPGDGETLPPGCIETTGRLDGPFVGKIYNAGANTFTTPTPDPTETGRQTTITTLLAKAPAAWTLADVATWLKAKL